MKKHIVLTGGPGVGKSTLLHEFARRGFSTLSESARSVIEAWMDEHGKHPNLHDPVAFQEAIAEMQLESENALPREEWVFLDRGLPDGLAYARLGGFPAPASIYTQGKNRYRYVFILAPLPLHKSDAVRLETRAESLAIQKEIQHAYESLGYAPIEVPPLPVSERAVWILGEIAKRDSISL